MTHIYRLLVVICSTTLVYAIAYQENIWGKEGSIITGIVAFILVGFLSYNKFLFPSLRSRNTGGMALGILSGLIAAYILQHFFVFLGLESRALMILSYLISILFFINTGLSLTLPQITDEVSSTDKTVNASGMVRPKLLDTSVIIDGRIMDIAETKFVEGPFIVPNYVLREIQLISDSSDSIKRTRGRRGLDMLNKLQERKDIEVKISYIDYSDIREVDAKLIRTAIELNAFLVTNDFNLNKVAALQKVDVLNLNKLTGVLKPIVLPGENIHIDVIREGKDESQGIGYMEDGTMVVVEDGGPLLGKKVEVDVTSVIQTAAGKMIFTKALNVIDDVEKDEGSNPQSSSSHSSHGNGRRGSGGRNRGSGDSRERGRSNQSQRARR